MCLSQRQPLSVTSKFHRWRLIKQFIYLILFLFFFFFFFSYDRPHHYFLLHDPMQFASSSNTKNQTHRNCYMYIITFYQRTQMKLNLKFFQLISTLHVSRASSCYARVHLVIAWRRLAEAHVHAVLMLTGQLSDYRRTRMKSSSRLQRRKVKHRAEWVRWMRK
jgi:hypothetical protein